MVVRRGIATVALAALASAPRVSRAQAFTHTYGVAGSAGYLFTVQSGQSVANGTVQPSTTSVVNDGFVSATLAGQLGYETPRTNQTLTAGAFLLVPFDQAIDGGAPVTYTGRLAYALAVEASESTTVTMGLEGAVQPYYSALPAVNASTTSIQALPTGTGYLFNLGANESITHHMGKDIDLIQATRATYTLPFDISAAAAEEAVSSSAVSTTGAIDAPTLSIANTLGLAKNLGNGRPSLTAGATYTSFGAETAGSTSVATRGFLTNTLIAGYERQLTSGLRGVANLGAMQIIDVTQGAIDAAGTAPRWAPTGSASLVYTAGLATATLGYSYALIVSPTTASLGFGDTGVVRFAIPVIAKGLSTVSTLSFTHLTPIGAPTLGNSGDVGGLDFGVTYAPPIFDLISGSLRGQVLHQAPNDGVDTPSTRVSITLALTFAFPSARAADASAAEVTQVYTPTPDVGTPPPPPPVLPGGSQVVPEAETTNDAAAPAAPASATQRNAGAPP